MRAALERAWLLPVGSSEFTLGAAGRFLGGAPAVGGFAEFDARLAEQWAAFLRGEAFWSPTAPGTFVQQTDAALMAGVRFKFK